ncbi:SRPBCC domain-containing protein [Microbacterium proteolyticum]|jgi:hypothetical protein|uniref:SRPBCC domain-containing protein n=1 Tax=Microbacterium proteolyticum TaxID=1572644 RepID=UPI001FAD6CA3|nr:SRPBCC domain-containing protein [Microbacterium proteolyticum]MCI9856943.1 SRPBCC domain-containing protein [Microbacterium proteolyticum]
MSESPARKTQELRRVRRNTALLVGLLIALAVAGAALWQRANPFIIETAIEIEAPPEVVWNVLTDFEAYPEWNPSLIGMTGALEPGSTLRFATDTTDEALVFEPVVREVRMHEHLRWEGTLLITGLFDGEHSFTLEPTAEGHTLLTQEESFRGVTVPFLTRWLDDNTKPDFVAMNEALKTRSESPTGR